MRRITYLRAWHERLGVPFAGDAQLRAPLVTLACALAFAAALHALETQRLRAATAEGAAFTRSLDAMEPRAAAVRTLAADVARRRAARDALARLRGSGAVQSNALVAVTNALPDGVWLTSLRADPGAFALSGRAIALRHVAGTLGALGARARLVAAREAPRHDGMLFDLAVARLP